MLKPEELAKMIDHTLLKPYSTDDDLKKLCQVAREYNFRTVAINNCHIPLCNRELEGTDVLTDAAVGFPLGAMTIEAKVFEAEDAIEKGAGEVDYVVNIGKVKSGDWDYVRDEMRRIVDACHRHGIICKVIFENCYLADEEKRMLCQIAVETGIDFIKTSTGMGTGNATLEDVRLMKQCVGDRVKVKAAGGIRNAADALKFIEAGASRLGTSAGKVIVDEYREMLK
ncbi:MAG: deoxyribose-phosphate aldolase [Erysipelotrichaceae bacterium]|nr:deoxyribose-phosphate aldolase [Erysipelotrichaceae bacterium]MBO4538128.1 deoxyribose-phosphate aldolase [Erysipelotrichaceae bacterium]MBR5048106.1 deoxyribose-phosphate aldolase [Erysipelotrichaceae bacterium]